MFWLRNKKNNFQLRTLIWGSDYIFKRDISNTMAFGNGLTNKDNIFMHQADTILSNNMELNTDFELLYLFACLHR